VEAETSAQEAIAVARRQKARSWELEATTGPTRLWRAQGKGAKARPMLAATYGWLAEGFDTPDLQETSVVIEELSYWRT
jgi:hypothetical protein